MKKIFLTVLLAFMLALPFQAHAGALVVDLTTSSSTTTSGDTIFQVSTTSGTYTTDLAAGDTVIPNLTNYSTTVTVQVDSLTFGNSLTYAEMGGVTFEVVAQLTAINDSTHLSGASEVVLNPGGTAVSGNSLYQLSAALAMTENMRFLLRQDLSSVSPIASANIRALFK